MNNSANVTKLMNKPNMKKYLKSFLILIVLLGILFLVVSILPQKDSRKAEYYTIFRNNTYRYSLDYPSFMRLGTKNDYGWNSLEAQPDIYLEIPGESEIFAVEADLKEPTTTLLKEYAEHIKEIQQQNAGGLNQITFSGKTAYSFTVKSSFSSGGGLGYMLGDDTFNYVIVENPRGQKLIIHYLLDSKKYPQNLKWAEYIVNSFGFIPTESWDKYGQFVERSCYYRPDDIKTEKDYVYDNTALNFSLTIPKGWFVPPTNDNDPHVVNCGNSDKGKSFEIQGQDGRFDLYKYNYDYYQKNLISGKGKVYTDIIPGAMVVEYIMENPEEVSWPYWYIIIFSRERVSFNFASSGRIEDNKFIETFKILK